MNKTQYAKFVDNLLSDMQALIRDKNADYSHGDDPFANFRSASLYGVEPLTGLCVRMQDKVARIQAFCQRGKLSVLNEGVEDAFKDLIGYSCLALGMLKEFKPSKPTPAITTKQDYVQFVEGLTPAITTKQDYVQFVEGLFTTVNEDITKQYATWDSETNVFTEFYDAGLYGVDPLVSLCVQLHAVVLRIQEFCRQDTDSSSVDSVGSAFQDVINLSCKALGLLEDRREGLKINYIPCV
jgi:hypothetical protein